MKSGSISVTSRPIKIGFLVNYDDKVALKKAILISSYIWGGAYNPIIPVYGRLPQIFKDEPVKPTISGIDMTKGYIEAFDADFYINYSKQTAEQLGIDKNFIITDSLVMAPADKGLVNYAISVPEVLTDWCNSEFKYVRNDYPTIYNVEFGKRHELFLGSIFGLLDPNIQKKMHKSYAERLKIKTVNANLANYTDFMKSEALYLRKYSQFYLRLYGRGGIERTCVFFMDATSWQDIVDYINLRALGRSVIPVAKQSATEKGVQEFVKDFIESNFQPIPNNPHGVYTHVNIIKSRGTTLSEVEDFTKTLNVAPIQNQPRVGLQRWYPRVWDKWARTRDSAECYTIEFERERQQVSSDEVEAPLLAPKFAELTHINGYPRYANDFSFDMFIAPEYYAEVLPSSIPNAARLLHTVGFDEWRFSLKGATHTSYQKDRTVHLTIPTAGEVFDTWANSQGLKIKLSTPGKVARQIVNKVGGPRGLDILADKLLLEQIQKLTSGPNAPRPITHGELVGLYNRIKPTQRFPGKADVFIWRLLQAKIIELGVEVQCPNCSKTSWYKLSGLNRSLTCSVCLDDFEIREEEPEKTFTWSYSLQGPFRLPQMADGAYTVVLALRFFTELFKSTITPQYSFTNEEGTFEADLGILLKQRFEADSDLLPMFVECKSFQHQFKPADINKMFKLGDTIKNSVLVFATLRDKLGNTEKKLLLQKLDKMRELDFKGKPNNEILILTANELFGEFSLAETWKTLGGKHATFENVAHGQNISNLCDVTQQLYLDAEPRSEWLTKKLPPAPTISSVAIADTDIQAT